MICGITGMIVTVSVRASHPKGLNITATNGLGYLCLREIDGLGYLCLREIGGLGYLCPQALV